MASTRPTRPNNGKKGRKKRKVSKARSGLARVKPEEEAPLTNTTEYFKGYPWTA
jgi:hypothetical protein